MGSKKDISLRSRRVCSNGHVYYKSSDCPVCPVCEKEGISKEEFLAVLSAPARRSLENAGIKSIIQLWKWKEKEILKLHGMGPASMPVLKKALQVKGLSFRK